MSRITLVMLLLAWVISPIPLFILWLTERKKNKKHTDMLRFLYMEKRITEEELKLSGTTPPIASQNVSPPQAVQMMQNPAQTGTLPPAPPQNSEDALAAAAARAAQIAEAELAGTALPQTESPAPEAESAASEIESILNPEAAPAEEASAEPAAEPAAEIPAAEPAAEPIAEPAAADASAEPAPEKAAAETTFVQPDSGKPAPVPPAAPPQIYRPQSGFNVSAITVMLSVGVLLIITAGLIFVRSAWSSLTDSGRLATLAAGSVLFFGTSALARRIWKLDRTAMAFFTLGAAFLPISVWAAGYLNLLGDGLSGADNPWLIALSAASFTVIALLAVKIYQQLGWGIAALCGLTVSYVGFAFGVTPETPTGRSVLFILLAAYALVFALASRILRQQQLLPLAIGRVIEPFAVIITTAVFCSMFVILSVKAAAQLSAVAVFLTLFAFFAPALTERLQNFTAIPTAILSVLGFGQLLTPVYNTIFTYQSDDYTGHYPTMYLSMLLAVCAAVWLILLLTNSLPENTRKGAFFAAVSMSVLSLPLLLTDISKELLIVPAAEIVVMVIWIIAAHKQPSKLITLLITAQSWMLCYTAAQFVYRQALEEYRDISAYTPACMLMIGLSLLCFIIFVVTKKHRTAASDLIFPLSAATAAFALLMTTGDQYDDLCFPACSLILPAIALLYWFMALHKDKTEPAQHLYAVAVPVVLLLTAVAGREYVDYHIPMQDTALVLNCWAIASFAVAFITYYTTKRRFHSVRKLLFGVMTVPPLLAGIFSQAIDDGDMTVILQLVCTAAALILWQIFAGHGFRRLETASFCTALLLILESTVYAVGVYMYDEEYNFTILMVAALWITVFSLLGMAVSKRVLNFIGSRTIPRVMQFAAPLTALILAVAQVSLRHEDWDAFFFIYTLGICLLAWLATKKDQIILPSVCGLSLILTLEALRKNTVRPNLSDGGGAVAVMLLCFAGLTILFPYLGIVAREAEDEPRNQRRSWVLTGLGGAMPFWLTAVAASDTYWPEQTRWLVFFIPILLAGFILHFASFAKTEANRKSIIAVSSGLGMIAFWLQPVVDVSDTFLEGKLHILPLIAFGIVIRWLYGEKVGGGLLFGIGVYSMLRLAFQAIASEQSEDVFTLLFAALVMFIASFYIKQKKWFLLGGISLVLTAAYMHMKLTEGRQWWIYLLLAGLMLIVVAASNEMLKQRGDSLKQRAGRLWEDWTW